MTVAGRIWRVALAFLVSSWQFRKRLAANVHGAGDCPGADRVTRAAGLTVRRRKLANIATMRTVNGYGFEQRAHPAAKR
jgi:hypothetical protein